MKDTWDRTFLLDRCLLPPWNSNSNLFRSCVSWESIYTWARISTGTRIPGYPRKKNSGLGKMHEKTRFSSSSSKKVVEEQPSCRVDCVTVFAVPVDPSLAGLLTAIVGSISKLRTNLSVHGIVLHLFTSSIIVLLSRRTTTKKMKSSCLSYCPILTSWNWQPGDNIIVTGWSDTSMHRQCTSVLR